MNRTSQIVIVAALVILVGAVAFLAAWDIPPPTSKVEKVLPDDRFPH